MSLFKKTPQALKQGAVEHIRPPAVSPPATPPRAYLDVCGGGVISGWAAIPDEPHKKLILEIFSNGKSIALVRADGFREDLAAQQVGDGHHAFSHLVFLNLRGGEEIRVKIADTGVELAGSPAIYQRDGIPAERYVIFADIVNNCNLRCPFCLTDYRRIKHTDYMSRATFARFIEFLPHVQDGGLMLSCVHEATLHPQLPEFLRMIPQQYRRKVMMTTNMAREKFSDELIDALADSGLHHLNISFDSLDPQTFAVLRKNGKFATFKHNIERLVAKIRDSANPPELRYITVVSRLNVGEAAQIVAATRELYLSAANEIREPQVVPHMDKEWKNDLLLSDAEWQQMVVEIDRLGQSIPLSYERYPSCRGNLDSVDGNSVNGWIMNERAPGEALEVEIFQRGVLLGKTLAGEFRPDLLAAGIGSGNYGFSFQHPGQDPLLPAEIEVRANGHTLTCVPPKPAQLTPPAYPLSLYVYPDGRLEIRGVTGFDVNINLVRDLPGLLNAL